jgi:hypothetical protein
MNPSLEKIMGIVAAALLDGVDQAERNKFGGSLKILYPLAFLPFNILEDRFQTSKLKKYTP